MKLKIMGKFLKTVTSGNVLAITLCPFGIYFRDKKEMDDKETVNHESIHWQQQLEMLVIFFYLWYLIEWGIRLFTNKKDAYYCISFEQEAYAYTKNFDYLKTRKRYAWVKYLKENIWKGEFLD